MTKKERERREAERQALAEIVTTVHAQMGGRAGIHDIARHVAATLGTSRYEALTWSGFVGLIRGALRTLDQDGLPTAVAVDGEYVQTVLLDVDEYRVVVAGYLGRARANHAMAVKFADECERVHGVVIDLDSAETA